MPELPEVETIRRGLRKPLIGCQIKKVLKRRDSLRWPLPNDFVTGLSNCKIKRLDRRAKFILVHLDNGLVWLIHLGMSGRILIHDGHSFKPGRHDHVLVETDFGQTLVYQDPRRFGMMDLVHQEDLSKNRFLKNLGPEPLSQEFDSNVLAKNLNAKKTSIKAALLDQRVLAGLGNIYACEALFWAGLSPRRLALNVTQNRAEKLVKSIRKVLKQAISNGGSTLRDYMQASGELGYFQNQFAVYSREGCLCVNCNQSIKRIVQSGRSTFFCSNCQR